MQGRTKEERKETFVRLQNACRQSDLPPDQQALILAYLDKLEREGGIDDREPA